jgi:hypothetical protein
MEGLLIFLSALVFYLLGRFSGHEVEVTKKVVKEIKKKINSRHAGTIDYPTQDQLDYRGSQEEKADQARQELFEKEFKP